MKSNLSLKISQNFSVQRVETEWTAMTDTAYNYEVCSFIYCFGHCLSSLGFQYRMLVRALGVITKIWISYVGSGTGCHHQDFSIIYWFGYWVSSLRFQYRILVRALVFITKISFHILVLSLVITIVMCCCLLWLSSLKCPVISQVLPYKFRT